MRYLLININIILRKKNNKPCTGKVESTLPPPGSIQISNGHVHIPPFPPLPKCVLTIVVILLAIALFACLISRIFSANEQCFSLTTNQQTVFSAK
jgi:hypothetical protein